MSRLDRDGEDASLFGDGIDAKIAQSLERRNGRNEGRDSRRERALSRHADEAARLCNMTIAEETRTVLHAAMLPVVSAAYRQAGLEALGYLLIPGSPEHLGAVWR